MVSQTSLEKCPMCRNKLRSPHHEDLRHACMFLLHSAPPWQMSNSSAFLKLIAASSRPPMSKSQPQWKGPSTGIPANQPFVKSHTRRDFQARARGGCGWSRREFIGGGREWASASGRRKNLRLVSVGRVERGLERCMNGRFFSDTSCEMSIPVGGWPRGMFRDINPLSSIIQ